MKTRYIKSEDKFFVWSYYPTTLYWIVYGWRTAREATASLCKDYTVSLTDIYGNIIALP